MDLHTSNTFVVNGKTYTSLDDMPPDMRAQFESMSTVLADKDQNGVPDIPDNLGGANSAMFQSKTIIFDGKSYASVDDLPPEGRAAMEKATGKLADENRDGIPDVIESALNSPQTLVTSQISGGSPRVVVQAQGSNMGPIIVLSIIAIGLAVIVLLFLGLVLKKGGL